MDGAGEQDRQYMKKVVSLLLAPIKKGNEKRWGKG
jgi:hypothetical protein